MAYRGDISTSSLHLGVIPVSASRPRWAVAAGAVSDSARGAAVRGGGVQGAWSGVVLGLSPIYAVCRGGLSIEVRFAAYLMSFPFQRISS